MSGLEGAEPGVLPKPCFGQVPCNLVAFAAGGTGGDVEELGADGRATGQRMAGQCQAAQRPGHRVGGDGQLQPARIGVEGGRGQVPSGPSIRSAKTCSITACPRWSDSALGELKGAIGEHRVVAVGGEELVLALRGGSRIESLDAPDDQAVLGAVARLAANAV